MAKKTVVILIVVGLDVAAAAYLAWRSFGLASLGILDFEIHHTAFAAVLDGKNPYDLMLLKSYLSSSLGYIPRGQFGFFYPPWTLVLLAPVLALPIKIAAPVWLAINAFLPAAISAVALSWQRSRSEWRIYVICGAILVFPPAIDGLMFGQINALSTFALVGVIWALDRRKDCLAGILIPIVLIKPHMAFLPLTILVLFTWQERRYRVFLWAAASFGIALILPCMLSPDLTLEWIRNFGVSIHYLGSTVQENNSLSSQIAKLIHSSLAVKPNVIKAIIPLASCGVFGLLFIKKRTLLSIDSWFIAAILLSPLLSGYSWFHDNVMLLVPYSIILGRAAEAHVAALVRNEIFIWAAILNFTTLGAMHLLNYETQLFWYPLAMLCLYWHMTRILPKNDRNGTTNSPPSF